MPTTNNRLDIFHSFCELKLHVRVLYVCSVHICTCEIWLVRKCTAVPMKLIEHLFIISASVNHVYLWRLSFSWKANANLVYTYRWNWIDGITVDERRSIGRRQLDVYCIDLPTCNDTSCIHFNQYTRLIQMIHRMHFQLLIFIDAFCE